MQNPVSRAYSSLTPVGPQDPCTLDWTAFGVASVGVWVDPAATVSYSVEVTLDTVAPADGSVNPNARWFTLADFPVGSAASKLARLDQPVQWIRINFALITGPVEFKLIQSGTGRY